jgi:hypothetical protein
VQGVRRWLFTRLEPPEEPFQVTPSRDNLAIIPLLIGGEKGFLESKKNKKRASKA